MTDNPLDKKPSRDEILSYRHVLMEQIGERMASDPDIHILDLLHELGVPRQLFLANLNNPTIRAWWDASQGRTLIHGLETGLADMETLRDRSALSLTAAGLDDKLAIIAAISDPFTEEGRKAIMELANYRAKLMPKSSKVTTMPNDEDRDMREELKRIRRQREELLRAQEGAIDAEFEPPE